MAQLSKYQVPNALSISRLVVFGPAVYWTATHDDWSASLVLLVLGVATDIFDGAIARRWGLETDHGRDLYEPWGDGVLSVGALLGLFETDHARSLIGYSMILFVLIHFVSNFFPRSVLYKRIVIWFRPLFYLAVQWALVWVYGDMVLTASSLTDFHRGQVVVTLLLIWFKRGRIGYWFDRIMQRPILFSRLSSK